MQYQSVITTNQRALCHLLLFFSLYEDETFEGEETYQVFSLLKAYPLTADIDFPEEVNRFFDYKNEVGDVPAYFRYLIGLIGISSPLLILFHAAQVALSDTVFSEKDSEYLTQLQTVLEIKPPQAGLILELALQERNMKMQG